MGLRVFYLGDFRRKIGLHFGLKEAEDKKGRFFLKTLFEKVDMSGKSVLNRLFALLLIALITMTFLFDLSESRYHIASAVDVKPDSVSIFKSSKNGNSALLGKVLYDFYPHNMIFIMPSNVSYKRDESFYRNFRLTREEVNLYSYPMKVNLEKYGFLLTDEGYKFLKSIPHFSIDSHNLKYHYIEVDSAKDGDRIAMYIYKNNIFVVPRSLVNKGGE